MSDVRALLKAKRQEARVQHPLATYTSAGQLRCALCDVAVTHAAAWAGHLGSKAHRTHVTAAAAARQREDEDENERAEAARQRKRREARPAADADAETEAPAKKHRADGALPRDFFSDPARAPSADPDDARASTAAAAAAVAAVEDEWLRFQQAVVNAPDGEEVYGRATVVAEPQLVAGAAAAGFPPALGDAREQQEEEQEEDEGARRRRRAQEDKEEIMDRLVEEERAQEEADARVAVLKSRLEAIRRRRSAKAENRA